MAWPPLSSAVTRLVFTWPPPRANLDVELASHPLAVAAFKVLEPRSLVAEARDRMLNILKKANEATEEVRTTSECVVVMARSP